MPANESGHHPQGGSENATSRPAGSSARAIFSGSQCSTSCRYRVMTNWKPTYAPNRAIMLRFARTSGPLRRIPSLTSGALLRRSIAMKVPSSARESANAPSVSATRRPRRVLSGDESVSGIRTPSTRSGPRPLFEIVQENAASEMNEFLARCKIADPAALETHVDSGPAATS